MFQKDRAVSTATPKRMWSPIVNKGDEYIYKKGGEEVWLKYKSTSSLLTGYKEDRDNVWIYEVPYSPCLVVGMAAGFNILG